MLVANPLAKLLRDDEGDTSWKIVEMKDMDTVAVIEFVNQVWP
ncbi:hypothetical protein ACH4Q7_35275 [Streptomyces roseolus]